jgi:GNAT superfamily N-acetyltransferase
MKIVRALLADAESLTRIAHAAKRHWGYPESWIEAWREQLTLTPEWIAAHETWVAVKGEVQAGWVSWTGVGRHARLEHLWVLPSAMGQGVGRFLFHQATTRAGAAGWKSLLITSDPNAAAFYRRMGAVQVNEERADCAGVHRVLPILEYRFANTPF